MIKNERQYRITKAQVDHFSDAIKHVEASSDSGLDPILRRAQVAALQSQLKDLQDEVLAYEALQAGGAQVVEAESFDEIPSALIRAHSLWSEPKGPRCTAWSEGTAGAALRSNKLLRG